MFEHIAAAPDDPILALAQMARADARPGKLDLSIGIYVDESGISPVMSAVRRAERRVLDAQQSKAYLPARGNAEFLSRLGWRVFSDGLWSGRLAAVDGMQSTGCVAALRLAAEVLNRAGVRRIWISDPTWPIHAPIFAAAGLEPVAYPYYAVGAKSVDWPAMIEGIGKAEPGDAVLLHGCCHNPSGADLDRAQWDELARLLADRGAIPLIDIAYAGLGAGWDRDLEGFRGLVEQVAEAVVAVSCSKSFGLYRERTGALYFTGKTAAQVSAALSQGIAAARTNYSMPPDHGAAVVAEILDDGELESDWTAELGRMRDRIAGLRASLADLAGLAGLDWEYLRGQSGMFSLLPLNPGQVARLREDHAIYMPANGRICIPSLSEVGCEHLVRSCASLAR